MALGGGTFTSQNKELPGAYINFVSAASASAALSDRGIATMPLELDWGVEGEVFEVTNEDFQKNSLKLFGYAFDSPKMLGLNDLFMGAKTLYAYRLNGGGDKAANTYATAKYCGVRGNDLKIVIQKNADDASKYDVTTYFGTVKVDTQTVAKAADLVANDYVTFKAADLAVTAGTPLTGGTNGTVDGTAHQAYLDKIESYTYNTMGVVVTDDVTKKLYVAFNKRLRDELGIKFQLVVYNLSADYMGVISVKNKVTDTGWSEAALVYWVTGAESGCAVNKSCQNKKYDGGFTVDTNYTQNELKAAIKAGEFTFHKVNGVVRVLEDINSTLDDTGYVIESRIEENSELFEMITNALDLTLTNTGEMYVLYDDFGKLTLKSLSSMYVGVPGAYLMIDEETGQDFEYTSSIDSNTYNKIKLTYDNEDTKKRDVYITQDSSNINKWGILQYFDTLQKGENGQAKADALLKLYNKKTRNLKITNALGDNRVRAGSMVVINLDLGDMKVKNWMLVEKCKHTYKEGEHWMDLTLRGGEFIA